MKQQYAAGMHLHGVGGHAPVQGANHQHPLAIHGSRAGSKYMTGPAIQHNVLAVCIIIILCRILIERRLICRVQTFSRLLLYIYILIY